MTSKLQQTFVSEDAEGWEGFNFNFNSVFKSDINLNITVKCNFASFRISPIIGSRPYLVGENDLPVAWEHNPWFEPEH